MLQKRLFHTKKALHLVIINHLFAQRIFALDLDRASSLSHIVLLPTVVALFLIVLLFFLAHRRSSASPSPSCAAASEPGPATARQFLAASRRVSSPVRGFSGARAGRVESAPEDRPRPEC